MTYQGNINKSMRWLGKKKDVVFMGQGLKNGGNIYGTMDRVRRKKCLEMPICENLIAGSAVGLAMKGYRPVIIFQRMDFMLIAADAIINHMALMYKMSNTQFKMGVIVRAIVGNRGRRFNVGPQHRHDFTSVFSRYIRTVALRRSVNIVKEYKAAYAMDTTPTLLVERKDYYE